MNLYLIRFRKETENLLPSITNNCETLIKQTHTKPQVTLEYKLTQAKQTISIKQFYYS